MKYVAGFLFNESMDKVVLIRKDHPSWQAGKLNGIGGKVGAAEWPFSAMVREFEEEAGVHRTDWIEFCVLTGSWGSVHFFFTRGSVHEVRTMESEQIEVVSVWDVFNGGLQTIPNLTWLLPMARSFSRGESAEAFIVDEIARRKM